MRSTREEKKKQLVSLTTISQFCGQTLVTKEPRPHSGLASLCLWSTSIASRFHLLMDINMHPNTPVLVSETWHLPPDLPFPKHPQEWTFKLLYEGVCRTRDASAIRKAINHTLGEFGFHVHVPLQRSWQGAQFSG